MSLTFNETLHEYRWKGRRVPSTTEVIGNYVRIKHGDLILLVDPIKRNIFSQDVMEDAADIGKAIHKGAEYLFAGRNLAWDALAEEIVAPLKQVMRFIRDFNVEVLHIEHKMYSTKYGYAGTCDLVAKVLGVRSIVDIKTGADTWAIPAQLAAYEKLYREESGFTGKMQRRTLFIPKDGSEYKAPLCDDPDAWAFFKARLDAHHYLQKRGIIK